MPDLKALTFGYYLLPFSILTPYPTRLQMFMSSFSMGLLFPCQCHTNCPLKRNELIGTLKRKTPKTAQTPGSSNQNEVESKNKKNKERKIGQ